MPENDSFNVHVGTLQKAEGLCTVRWIETHTVLCRERARALTLRRRLAIALPHRMHDANANRRSRYTELDTSAPYQRSGVARESQRAPPVGDDARSHAHGDDVGGPAEPPDAQRDAGCGAPGPEGHDDCVGWRVELRAELERRKEVADHRAGIRAASRNPPRLSAAEATRSLPRAQHCPRQRDHAGCADDNI